MERHESRSFAVFVLTRDHARFIEECINSILETFGADVALLVIDTGSLDDTLQILAQLCDVKVESNISLRHMDRGTTSLMALEQASRQLDADYVLMISGDDYLSTGVDQAIDEFLESNPVPTVINFSLELVDVNGDHISFVKPKWAGVPTYDRKKLLMGNPGTAPGSVLPWRQVQSLNHWPNDPKMLIEDYWLWWSLLDKAAFVNSDRGCIKYRQHETSIMGSQRNPRLAYSIGYCVGLAQNNAKSTIEWFFTGLLLFRWTRKVNWRDFHSLIRGRRASRALD